MTRGAWTAGLAAGVILAAPGAARAACAGTPPGAPPPPPPVSFEGVALSGPTAHGDLLAPGRILVLRYLTGGGPRVVRVDTGLTPISRLSEQVALVPGVAYYGEAHHRRIAPRQRISLPVCGGSRPISPPRSLRPAAPTATRSPGGTRWRARLIRGPFGLRCLQVARDVPLARGHRECERATGPTSAVIGLRSTAGRSLVSAQAPRLRAMTIVTSGGSRTVAAARGTRVALAAYDRPLTAEDVRLALRFAGGRRRTVVPYASSR